MKTVRVVYYNLQNIKKIADFKILNDDKLELIKITDYVLPIKKSSDKNFIKHDLNNKIVNKIGIGDLVASFTKLFGFKPCAPCDKRRKYLNKITPKWISNIIGKFYT